MCSKNDRNRDEVLFSSMQVMQLGDIIYSYFIFKNLVYRARIQKQFAGRFFVFNYRTSLPACGSLSIPDELLQLLVSCHSGYS